jgi:hypothetical protein
MRRLLSILVLRRTILRMILVLRRWMEVAALRPAGR